MKNSLALTALVLLAAPPFASAQQRTVDFGYAPATHLTAICFPSDWQKTLVNEKGSLVYDFGPGPYVRPLTEVSVGVKGRELALRHLGITDPRVPVAEADYAGGGITLRTESFALVPSSPPGVATSFTSGRVTRLGGLNGAPGWATPQPPADPALQNVAWGTNRPILYRVKLPAGEGRRVALGICEPYKGTRGQRVLELRVEGAPTMTVDALKDLERNRPYVYLFDARDLNNDGEIGIEVHASPTGIDPNVILNAFWIFPPGTAVTEQEIIRGDARANAELVWSCGRENELNATSARIDGILARFEGGKKNLTPTVTVRSQRALTFDPATGVLASDGRPYVLSRPSIRKAVRSGTAWTLELPPGTRKAEIIVVNGPTPPRALLRPDLTVELSRAKEYWMKQTHLPFGRITVPDTGIQYILDASIRNLYQISEWVDGSFQFQPGPSVYRGLWIHDQTWDIPAAAMLGDTLSARLALETMLRYQKADGQIVQSEPFPMQRETPLVLFSMVRYSELSGNTPWLKTHWGNVTGCVNWIRKARGETLNDPSLRHYGLFPPGFADGGLGGVEAEYGSSYWALNGLRSAAHAASSLGLADSARSWSSLADEIMTSFRKAAARDARRDKEGNLYLPMKVGDTSSTILPQQANWGMLDGQGIGHLFPYDDSLVTGTLAMLDAASKEGIPQSVGWLKDGVWPFLGALHGITYVYQRNYTRARDLLYAYANHASPLGTWVEEQLPKELGTKTAGDASDATAGTLYIKLLRRLIAIERGDTLDLLAGVPPEWYMPGARLRLDKVLTDFGPFSLDLKIAPDGKSCLLVVGALRRKSCVTRLALDGLKAKGFMFRDGSDLPPFMEFRGRQGGIFSFVRTGS